MRSSREHAKCRGMTYSIKSRLFVIFLINDCVPTYSRDYCGVRRCINIHITSLKDQLNFSLCANSRHCRARQPRAVWAVQRCEARGAARCFWAGARARSAPSCAPATGTRAARPRLQRPGSASRTPAPGVWRTHHDNTYLCHCQAMIANVIRVIVCTHNGTIDQHEY